MNTSLFCIWRLAWVVFVIATMASLAGNRTATYSLIVVGGALFAMVGWELFGLDERFSEL